jgi:DNA ligase (NAD+)
MTNTLYSTEELRNLILKAKHAYYYSGEPIMSDAEYDALEDQLRQLAPDDPLLALVGSPVPTNTMLTKARHSIPMGSQSKVNSEAEFMTWAQKSEGSAIHASLKGDGASAAAYYQQGRLVQAISRGDGTVGEDITANAMRFKGLPAWVGAGEQGFTGAVRFEVILTVADWTAIDPSRSKNPRNAGNGIMGRKNGHQSDCLTIFAFDIDESIDGKSRSFAMEAEKSQRLAELGFNLIPQRLCATADEAVAFFRETTDQRDRLPFWIDGVVLKMNDLALQERMGVTSGRPKGQIAWKFDSSGAETELVGVVISGGHTGSIVPTGQLRPVDIGGTTVSSVSLVNFDEIARLDLAVGDSVWVIKANDIIPKVVRVTERPKSRKPILAPLECPFCGGEVGRRINTGGDEGVILECRNAACPKKSSGKINRWISSLDILGIGDVVLESMLDQLQIEDAADLYTLKSRFNELANMVTHAERGLTLGEKRATNILEAIEAKRVLTLSQFLGSLGLEHLGKRRVEIMIRSAKGELDTLQDWRSGKLREARIAELAGAPNIAIPIQDGIDAMALVIDKMLVNGVEILPPQDDLHASDEVDQSQRQTVCISGKLPSGKKKADYQQPLLTAGYELVDEVTKDLTYLVLADATSSSSKAVKARKLGVSVISEEELVDRLQLD